MADESPGKRFLRAFAMVKDWRAQMRDDDPADDPIGSVRYDRAGGKELWLKTAEPEWKAMIDDRLMGHATNDEAAKMEPVYRPGETND